MSTDFSVIKGREETSLAVEWHIKHKISPPTRVRDCHKWAQFVMKTRPCNVYPLEPHFYIAKLGYAGVYLFFLFLLQNIDCGYSLEPPRRGGSNEYPQSMF